MSKINCSFILFAENWDNKIKNMEFISYGAVSSDFKVMVQMTSLLNKIKQGEIKERRLDCYIIPSLNIIEHINKKFESINFQHPTNVEVFIPSINYPAHTDEGGTSYFIPLEEGIFSISGVNYPIVPFVLYAFEDSKLHNTNFGAIMLK